MSSAVAPPRLALALAMAALVAVLAGLLLGIAGGRKTADASADGSDTPAAAALRDPSLALRMLGEYRHWGSYRAPDPEQAPTGQQAAAAAPSGSTAGYRLVGIERRGAALLALLLPEDAPASSTEVLRLGEGATLAAGVTVRAIGANSVVFDTAEGPSTLYLYGPVQ